MLEPKECSKSKPKRGITLEESFTIINVIITQILNREDGLNIEASNMVDNVSSSRDELPLLEESTRGELPPLESSNDVPLLKECIDVAIKQHVHESLQTNILEEHKSDNEEVIQCRGESGDSFLEDIPCDLSMLNNDPRMNHFEERKFDMNQDGPSYNHSLNLQGVGVLVLVRNPSV